MKYDRSIRYRVTRVSSIGLTFGSIYYRTVFFKWVHFIIHYYFFSPGVTQKYFFEVTASSVTSLTIRKLSKNYQKTIKKLFNNYSITIRKLSENYQKTIRKLSKNYQKTIKKLSKNYQKTIRKLSENYSITIRKLSENYRKTIQ